MKLDIILVCVLTIVLLGIDNSNAARGGSRSGSRGGFRSKSTSRSRSSGLSRVRLYRGHSYTKGSWKTAAAVGVVFGLMSYKRRSLYYRYPDREPRICFNDEDLHNGTYGYFICPEDYMSDTYDHCCGDTDEQYCCPYSERSSGLSRVRLYHGPSYTKGSWKTAEAEDVVFGLKSYKRRSLYYRYPDKEPRICFNDEDLHNGTYGYFVCPEDYMNDTYDHCCGDTDEQYCCPYSESLKTGGRIAGIVVGVIFVCVVVGVIVFCCIKRRKGKQGAILRANKPGGNTHVQEQVPLTHNYNATPTGGDVPMQSYAPGNPMPPPQAYDPNAQGLPYSSAPGGAGFNPPGGQGYGGQVPYPSAPAPYTGEGQPPPPGFIDEKTPLPPGDVSYSQFPGQYPPPGPYGIPSDQPPPYTAN